MRTRGLWLAFAILGASAGAHASVGDVSGVWRTGDDGALVSIRQCGATLCGEMVRQPGDGLPLELVGGFQRRSATRWVGGRIYDPADGSTYVVDVELVGAGRLQVRGCWLAFCETQLWDRAQ